MPRKKLGFDQRLNFWVSQESYDFYTQMADKRGDKLSELLREVLDYAMNFFDEEGRFELEALDDQEWIKKIAKDAAAQELRAHPSNALAQQVKDYLATQGEDLFKAEIEKHLQKHFSDTPQAQKLLQKALENVENQYSSPPSIKRKRNIKVKETPASKLD